MTTRSARTGWLCLQDCRRSPDAAPAPVRAARESIRSVIGPNQPGIRVAMMLNRDAPIGENSARSRQEIGAVESEPMRVGLGDLDGELFVDVIAERRLDEILGITDASCLEACAPCGETSGAASRGGCTPGSRRAVHRASEPATVAGARSSDSSDPRPPDETNRCLSMLTSHLSLSVDIRRKSPISRRGRAGRPPIAVRSESASSG